MEIGQSDQPVWFARGFRLGMRLTLEALGRGRFSTAEGECVERWGRFAGGQRPPLRKGRVVSDDHPHPSRFA